VLVARLKQAGTRRRVRVVRANALRWLSSQRADRFDAVLSSELLPELDTNQMQSLFIESHRVLRPGGVTVHVILSPNPANSRQRLVIEADSDPRWTRRPPRKWFSPSAAHTVRALAAAGFPSPRSRRGPGGLTARGEAAQALLKRWGVRADFTRTYAGSLRKGGLELPDWIVAFGSKPH
jgi:SAM-dependent methyltransferase